MADENVRKRFASLGNITFWQNIDDTRGFIKTDVDKWNKVVADAKIEKL